MALDAGMRAAIVDSISAKLRALYVYPEIAVDYEAFLRETLASGGYDSIGTVGAFANRLSGDLLSVHWDGHLRVFRIRGQPGPAGEEESDEARLQREVTTSRFNNFGFSRLERLPGNVGLLDLREFDYPDRAAETAVAAMQFLSYASAVIVDLRQNPGGRGELGQLLLSYFFDDHRTQYAIENDRPRGITRQWWTLAHVPGRRMPNVPLYVLTSENTGSAAEEFAYALKHCGRATLVGDTTAGAAHKTHVHTFPALHVGIAVPDGNSIHPVTGTDWERTGVIPHIAVPPDEALQVAHEDALETLLEAEADEHTRFLLQWARQSVAALARPVTLTEAAMRQYVGHFGPRRITLDDGTLYYQRADRPQFRLVPLGEDWFMLDGLEYFRLRFRRGPSGAVTVLEGWYDDGSHDANERTSG